MNGGVKSWMMLVGTSIWDHPLKGQLIGKTFLQIGLSNHLEDVNLRYRREGILIDDEFI